MPGHETPRQDLIEAYRLIQQGERRSARRILKRLIREHPDSERVWLLMSLAVPDKAQKLDCLNRVLKLNPRNPEAQRMRAELDLPAPRAAKKATTILPPAPPMPAWLTEVTSPGFRPEVYGDEPAPPPPNGGLEAELAEAGALAGLAEASPAPAAQEMGPMPVGSPPELAEVDEVAGVVEAMPGVAAPAVPGPSAAIEAPEAPASTEPDEGSAPSAVLDAPETPASAESDEAPALMADALPEAAPSAVIEAPEAPASAESDEAPALVVDAQPEASAPSAVIEAPEPLASAESDEAPAPVADALPEATPALIAASAAAEAPASTESDEAPAPEADALPEATSSAVIEAPEVLASAESDEAPALVADALPEAAPSAVIEAPEVLASAELAEPPTAEADALPEATPAFVAASAAPEVHAGPEADEAPAPVQAAPVAALVPEGAEANTPAARAVVAEAAPVQGGRPSGAEPAQTRSATRPASAAQRLKPGTLLRDRYRIMGEIGRGQVGTVYRAYDEVKGADVAIKERAFTTPDAERQFQRDAALLLPLWHTNLPRVSDAFVVSRQHQYLVMEYIPGQSLKQLIAERGRAFTETEALAYLRPVVEALDHLHRQVPAIAHGDIKPENVRVTEEGRVYLVDYGLATLPGLAPSAFLAPEQVSRGWADAASDLYGLAATLYYWLTQQLPSGGAVRMSGDRKLVPIQQLNPQVSGRTARAIERALNLTPEARFASVVEFATALPLEVSFADVPEEAPAPARPNWLWVAVGVVALAAAVAGGLWWAGFFGR